MTMSMIAAGNANRARQETQNLIRKLCRESYDSEMCDDLCLKQHKSFLEPASKWEGKYEYSYTSICNGPVPTPHVEVEIKEDIIVCSIFGFFLIFAIILWRILRV